MYFGEIVAISGSRSSGGKPEAMGATLPLRHPAPDART